MHWLFICLMILISGVSVFAADSSVDEVQSTQGIEINKDIVKTVKPSAKERKEYNKRKKTADTYIKNKKKINKMNSVRNIKQKELEFLQNRLEVKKMMLEDLTSTPNVKGEK